MYRDTNHQILEEINNLDFLREGKKIGENDSGRTTVISIGKFYSETLGRELDIALKKYSNKHGDVLDFHVAQELGMIDLIEENLPQLVVEFPIFHGVCLDTNGQQIGVITEDYSCGGIIPVRSFFGLSGEELPYEIQEIIGKKDKDDLATVFFLANGKRRIGDFGELTEGTLDEKIALSENYLENMEKYSVKLSF